MVGYAVSLSRLITDCSSFGMYYVCDFFTVVILYFLSSVRNCRLRSFIIWSSFGFFVQSIVLFRYGSLMIGMAWLCVSSVPFFHIVGSILFCMWVAYMKSKCWLLLRFVRGCKNVLPIYIWNYPTVVLVCWDECCFQVLT